MNTKLIAAPLTPCEMDPNKFTSLRDNPSVRAECRKCIRRLECALDTLQQVNKGLHPTGCRAGVWMPDDKRADGRCSSPARRYAIEKLRSVAAVLARAKHT